MAVANAAMIRSGGIFSRVAAGAGLAITGIGIASLKSAGNFQQSMNILGAVSGATTKQMAAMHKEALALGADLKLPNVSAKDAADSMAELAKAGLSVKDVMAATRGVLQFGIAANVDFADSANIVARSLTAFHLSGQNAVRVADLFTAAANKSTAEASDMALGFQMASARFASTHQSIEDLTTAITLMANAGIIGSDAGTSLKTMMNRLVAPTKKAQEEMHKMGFEVYDSSGHMKKLPAIIGNLNQSLKGMSEAQKNAALYTLFGSDAIRAATVLTDAGVKGFDRMKDSITKGGEAQQFAEARTKGFNGAIQGLLSTSENFAIQLGERMLPAATQATQGLTSFIASLDPNKIADFAGGILGVVADIGKLAFGTRAGQSAILGLVAAFLTYKTAVLAANAANAAYMGVLNLLTSSFSRFSLLTIATAAVIGLGVALHHFLSAAQGASAEAQHYIDTLMRLQQISDGARNATNELADAKLGVKRASLDVALAERQVHTALVESGKGSLDYKVALLGVSEAKQRQIEASQRLHTAQIKEHQQTKLVKDSHDELSNASEKLRQHYKGLYDEGTRLIRTGTGLQLGMKLQKDATQGLQVDLGKLAEKADSVAKANAKSHPQIAAAAAKIRDQALATEALTRKLDKIPSAVAKAIPAAKAEAVTLGNAVTQGVLAGSAGLAASLGAQLAAAAVSAIATAKAAIGAHSPSRLAANEIGKPLADGIILGYLNGTADLPDKVSERVRKSLDKAKEVIDKYRDKIRSAFERMAGDVDSAFDAITQNTLTPAEALLNNEQNSRDAAELQRNLDDANQRYSQAMNDADATDQDRADALRAVQDAQWEIRKAGLERQAALERKEYDAQREQQKRSLDDQLADLEEKLAENPKKHDFYQKQIIALLKKYGVDYDSVGNALGQAYATGMRKSMKEIRKTAIDIVTMVMEILNNPKKYAGTGGGGSGGSGGGGGGGGGNSGPPKWSQVPDTSSDGWSQIGGSTGVTPAAGGGGAKTAGAVMIVNVDKMVGGDKDQLALDLLDPLRGTMYDLMGRNGGSIGIS